MSDSHAALYVGLALATTALGTLLPMLGDAGEMDSAFGTHVLAVGAVGEFGPVALMALVFSGRSGLVSALVLNLFALAVLGSVLVARRWRPRRVSRLIERTIGSSGQVGVRLTMLVLVSLVVLATFFGLEFLLGAFAAGLVVGQAVSRVDPGHPVVESLRQKYEGIGFGMLIPIFFIVSGMQFDLRGLLQSGAAVLLVPLVAVLFLVVRGVPAYLVSGRALPASARPPLALFAATELPLVIAITDRGVAVGDVSAPLATAMVAAGMLSVFLFPPLGLGLRRRSKRLSRIGLQLC
ncbi:MAG: cation:proton antiporter [Chloroflexi bacterium]|nr:cation:proton antiporter [Chloroflexota bacterium]